MTEVNKLMQKSVEVIHEHYMTELQVKMCNNNLKWGHFLYNVVKVTMHPPLSQCL